LKKILYSISHTHLYKRKKIDKVQQQIN